MFDDFELACGSVVGRHHAICGKNNQDTFTVICGNDVIIAAVSDGCSAGEKSEIGSTIGSALICNGLLTFWSLTGGFFDETLDQDCEKILERARLNVLAQIRVLVNSMGGRLHEIISEDFLFTIIGCIISRSFSVFFSIGDGIIVVNNEIIDLGTFGENAPPFLCYPLMDPQSLPQGYAEGCKFHIEKIIETKDLHSVILGTDGLKELHLHESKKIPGMPELVGPLQQFVTNDKFFSNPFGIQRRLSLMNRDVQSIDWEKRKVNRENGLLYDDTTVVAIRRKKPMGE